MHLPSPGPKRRAPERKRLKRHKAIPHDGKDRLIEKTNSNEDECFDVQIEHRGTGPGKYQKSKIPVMAMRSSANTTA